MSDKVSPVNRSDGEAPEAVQFLEQQLITLIRRVRSRVTHAAHEVHPDLDTTAYGILSVIESGEATSVSAIAQWSGVGKPTISRQVSALELLGLISRQQPESGTRTVHLELTDTGLARFRALRALRLAGFRRGMANWDQEDITAFGQMLARFNSLDW